MTTPTPAPSLESFFSGGGGKSVSWKDKPIGTRVSGTIKAVHPPQQVTDLVTKEPKFKKNGQPVTQVRIDLLTSERDPSEEDDDGTRSLYVGGWMIGAVGDALRKAGREGPPEVGATLTVALIERTPPETPGLNPTNKFAAAYVPPTAAATQQFFGQGQPAAAPAQQPGTLTPEQIAAMLGAQAPQQQPVPQPNIGGTGYVNPPAPVAAPPAPAQAPLPPKPDMLSDAAWAAMPDDTKRQVAASIAPF